MYNITKNNIVRKLIIAKLTILQKIDYIHVLLNATYTSIVAYAQISMR